MMKSKIYIVMVTALLLSSPMMIPSVQASPFSQHDLDGITINSGDYHGVELGTLATGKEVSITYFASEEIDGLLMTDAQYQSWIAGSADYILNGSELDTTLVSYTYTVETTDDYWYVLDNSAQNPDGVNTGLDSTISTGGINIADRLTQGLQTRIVLEPGDTFSYDIGSVPQGNLLELSVICEGWFFEHVDTFVVSGSNSDAFAAGSDVWNRNASDLDTCFQLWSYEVESADSWAIHIENGPRGEAIQSSTALRIDLHFWTRAFLPGEISRNTRMIETDESWRVDLGSRQAGDTLTFGLTLDGLLSQVDVLIMESSQADLFLSGETATVLGHPSLINVNFFDSWDYRFPRSGSYTMILDNTPEPQGGANEGSPIHAKFYVIETTILSEWFGWYESRHYVEDGSFVSFDLGELQAGDEFRYTVTGRAHGSGFMNTFDVLVFTDAEYQLYVSGTGGSLIESYSTLDVYAGTFGNHTVAESGHYWIVIDAADGPTGGADANGAWTFDFMLASEGSVTSPQMEDSNYEMTATNLGNNIPDPVDDGSDGGGSNNGGGTGTGDGGSNGGADDTTNDDTNGMQDIGEAKSSGVSSSTMGGCAFLLVAIVVGVLMRRRKKLRGRPVQVHSTQQSHPMAVQATTGQAFQTSQPAPVQATAAPQSGVIPSWEQLPPGGTYDYSTGVTIYVAPSGQRWVEQMNGTFEAESAVYSQPEPPHIGVRGVVTDGFEWIDYGGVKWYRVANSGSQWARWQ